MKHPLCPLLLIFALTLNTFAAEPSQELIELRKERRAIEAEIRMLIPDTNKRDDELASLQRKSIDASKAYQQAIDEHPNLAKYKSEMKAATSKLTDAISSKNESAKNAARQEISDLMKSRMEAAAKEPDLQPLAKANHEAGAAYMARHKEVLASLPETKDLAAKLDLVNSQIQKELAKSR